MPPLAIAGVAAAATVGGAALSASATNKASKRAAASAERTAEMNNALQRETYEKNTANLAPFMQRGNAAGDSINALLGLPTYQAPPPVANNNAPVGFNQGGAPAPQPLQAPTQSPLNALMASIGPKRTRKYNSYFAGNPNLTDDQKTQYLLSIAHGNEQRLYQDALGQQNAYQQQQTQQAAQQQAQQDYVTAQPGIQAAARQNAQDGFRQYIDNSDYGFRQNEGNRGINAGYAANGLLQSGAAMKALEKYRANLNAGYRNEYLGYLGNQQQVGLSGANALAGVGTAYAGQVSNNNNNASDAFAAAALNRGNANASMFGTIGGSINGLASGLGSSFGGGAVANQGPIVSSGTLPRYF